MSEPASYDIQVPQPIEVLHGGGTALACNREGWIFADQLHGLFAGDTRVLSTYRIGIGGYEWALLSRSRPDAATAEWNYQNQALQGPAYNLPAGTLHLTLRRRLSGALHDDLHLCSFCGEAVRVRLSIRIDADFSDIFEVKDGTVRARFDILRVPEPHGLTLLYDKGDFRRGVRIRISSSGPAPQLVGTMLVFDLELASRREWTCCLEAAPVIDDATLPFHGDPHRDEPLIVIPGASDLTLDAPPILAGPFARGRADLHSLAIAEPGRPPFPAAGVPWFLTLFGRDTLFTTLMAGLDGPWLADGTLTALGTRQATERNDWRDAEPGKFPHEIRRGELAARGEIPHAAYYGAHDVPALFTLALWQAWRWTGRRALLDAHLPAARAGLEWCDTLGDRDGDGLQEYATRSSRGYYNQSWKDSGDAIVHADGRLAELPIATVELQGYLFAARLAMAELLEESGEKNEAKQLRASALELRALVENRYWMPEAGFYAQALNGAKEQVASISSNPGQLLWCGLPSPERAAAVAERLLRDDLFSGWGLRTLSSDNPAYNPLSYQCGSVWPFDGALTAAGLMRYGLRDRAAELLRAILEAALHFEQDSLPELFCGTARCRGLPVPYASANRPQAWSAAVPYLAAQLFLGLVPDAPRGRCSLTPWLPEWLPHLALSGIAIGDSTLSIRLVRRGEETVIESLQAPRLEVTPTSAPAPLWGEPFGPI